MPYDNVIIFGAGASFDAGIPLLNTFVDTMWSYAIRERSPQGAISAADKTLLDEANAIRVNLERYNSRANFNMRNLEDVLSLLSFESLAGGGTTEDFETWVRAITRTIELSCRHHPPEADAPKWGSKDTPYHAFWHAVLGTHLHKSPPALLTFNYDLVFERTLLDYFSFLANDSFRPSIQSCKIQYGVRPYDFVVESKKCRCEVPIPNGKPASHKVIEGFRGEHYFNRAAEVEIPYLKLHGSLNWCARTVESARKQDVEDLIPGGNAMEAAQTPLILPPVFNKMNSANVGSVWQKALEILREAKHIIIVGYSLPKTDIYMQYFLKSAVGPNSNLQRIIVYDPSLFRKDASTQEMQARYRDCFSPQFQERITFEPPPAGGVDLNDRGKGLGTLFHFVQTLKHCSADLLFTL